MVHRTKILAIVSSVAVAGTLGAIGVTQALAATAGPIRGLGGKCVDVAGAATADGTRIQLFDCNGTGAQKWTVGDDGTVRALGKCMTGAGAGTGSGAKVHLAGCTGSAAQTWKAAAGALVNGRSGLCLDATDRSSANRTALQVWSCTGGSNQRWTLPGSTTPPTTPPTSAPTTGPTAAPTTAPPTTAPPTTAPTTPPTSKPPTTPPTTPPGGGLDRDASPGANFDLAVWQLQQPVGSPGRPVTISPSRLEGGYQDQFFYTDPADGAMTFFAPEKGVTTPNSKFARSELREMNRNGGGADWSLKGTHRMSATLRVVSVTRNVAIGQIKLGSGGPSTKPLAELYYRANGDVIIGIEKTAAGGQTLYTLGRVPVGTKFSYAIAVVGGRIQITLNGATSSYAIHSSFLPYRQYFKAGSYNQSSSDSTTNGARVAFYSLTVSHS
ncbi:polysaccharide lyase family 7 protein [Spirilliplanes yamanashiensis]|uniref:Ricin B lectin domain-containing protein n=1 Tax=Spirilliplanes yamanashiensis TaxID=42233 RepID=A0A8J3Y6Y6_9ACTN|nr:polysaccharide lyase family 7 protein [Spirilliplanes yamanashiensis]MDP9817333.1 hypothetical protein [Spirilliplanes yamanashiensis]GIJ03016.1 hypothetical protein Sya03_23680 [Spirilliplanes yamanashiensis]